MLILTRKKGESIQIGSDIEIKIISVNGDQVKLGIDAPKTIDIYRKELYEEIQLENQNALSLGEDLSSIVESLKKQE
ncbi:carbon storage regulator CsrA [Peribacillus kribbensis]|uniref:carbon storage regulator CsrA n=1 Tax=Peribacillus kribbensis TaxID=356658 RepID=UPI000421A107|nr:carbon storage regulator CsrA [Peribacillus kribbensis]